MVGAGKGPTRRRAQILQAAQACFLEEGFHAAGMARIAARAELSVGQIYRYFAGKEEIVAAIIDQDLEAFVADLTGMDGGPDAVARRVVQEVRATLTAERRGIMFEVWAEASRNPRFNEVMTRHDERVRTHLREALSRDHGGGWSADEVDTHVDLVCLLVEGLIVRSGKIGSAELDRLAEVTTRILADALGARTGEPSRGPTS